MPNSERNPNTEIRKRVAVAVAVLASLFSLSAAQHADPAPLVTAANPAPQNLPTLSVWEDEKSGGPRKLLMVAAQFPNVPDFTCDSWCYESEVDFIGARAIEGGRLELRHRVREQSHVVLVTTFTPEPGAVELVARAELDSQKHPGEKLQTSLLTPNLCWQLRHATPFASQ